MKELPENTIYQYWPSLPLTVVSLSLFAVLTAWHSYITIKKKVWYWTPFTVGVLFEFLGYSVRIGSRNNPANVPLYAVQLLFVLLAPALFAASIYMTLGRMLIFYKAEFASIVSVRKMTRIFVLGDVLSFLLQCGGGGVEGSSKKNERTGAGIVIGGLVVQLIFFGMFVITSLIANTRLIKNKWPKNGPGRIQWQGLLNLLYVLSILILVRSIFRVIEYADGWTGYLMSHEVYMYVFDTLLMFLAVVIAGIFHPVFVIGATIKKPSRPGSDVEIPEIAEVADTSDPFDPSVQEPVEKKTSN